MSNTPIWQVHRRPPKRMMLWSCFLAALFLGFATMLIPLLMDGSWYWHLAGAAIGCFLASILIHSVWAGARCRVEQQGTCTYGFGSIDNISFPLQSVRSLQYINAGVLTGIGVDIDIEQIVILHRKGISISKMHSQNRAIGCPLVLEFLSPEDLESLESIRQSHPPLHSDSA